MSRRCPLKFLLENTGREALLKVNIFRVVFQLLESRLKMKKRIFSISLQLVFTPFFDEAFPKNKFDV